MISAVRNFAITFGISLLVFGLLAWFLSSFAVSSMTGGDGSTDDSDTTEAEITTEYDPFQRPDQTGEALKDVKGSTFTMLLVGVNYEETTAEPVVTEEPPLTGEPDDTEEPPSPPSDTDTTDTSVPETTEKPDTKPAVTTEPKPPVTDKINEPSTPHKTPEVTDAIEAPAVPEDNHAASPEKETQQSAIPPLVQGSAFQIHDTETAEDEEDGFYTENLFAESIVIVRMDKDREEVLTTALSKDTRIMVDGVSTTLAEVLRDKGIEYFCDKVTALTGLNIDYYAVTPVASFVEIVDMVGGVTMTIDEAIDYKEEKEETEDTGNAEGADKNDKNDKKEDEEEPEDVFSLKLSAGEQRLNGETAVDLFYYMYEVKGDTSCQRTLRQFARAFLSNLKKCTSEADAPALFKKMQPLIDTNITEAVLSEQIEFLLHFDDLESVDIVYPGKYTEDGGEVYFTPDVATATYQMMPYKQ